MGELFHMLARRLARALNLSHSSVIFAKCGDLMGTVASAHEDPQLENLQVELDKYPEIEAALASEKPVLIPDIWHSESYKKLREAWEKDGSVISVRSIIALPFRLDLERTGVFLLRRTADTDGGTDVTDVQPQSSSLAPASLYVQQFSLWGSPRKTDRRDVI